MTEDQLVTLIYDLTSNVMNEFVPDLEGFFRRHQKMDLKEVGIDARVLKYYRNFLELIEQHGFGRLLGVGLPSDSTFGDRMQLRWKILVDNLEPQVLRDDVQRYVQYERRSAKKNDFELFRIIKERARTQHKYHVLNMEYKQKAERSGEKKSPARDPKPRKDREQRRGGDNEKPEADGPPTRGASASPPADGCLHCGGGHWLRSCPTASEEDRRRPLEKLRSQREETKRSKTVRNDLQRSPKSGELEELGCDAKLSALADPVTVIVAGGGQIECTMEAEVDLQLQTAAGMVRVSSVACLVMGGYETEFLLGDNTLKSLGIKVHRQLEQPAGGDVVADDDPFEPEAPAADASVATRLEAMLDDVLREGFDPDLHGS
ncbi:unnamed protein product [Phytophthora fragariaefolia]|uniref:Unnamed protein product n=1 Tax=Phytophthora fragariaefolia TaxID=1490495 RepID=A0A9W6X0R4_9STRA|nr:unnamed protein product [Phytophthora fragariaefolia]